MAGRQVAIFLVALFFLVSALRAAEAQCPMRSGPRDKHERTCRGPGPHGMDQYHRDDMETFQFLLEHRDEITRRVNKLPDGIETITESNKPEVVAKLQEHVQAMYKRLDDKRPIHARDPLFADLFRNADKIQVKFDKTRNGVHVLETAHDPHVVKLIHAHADVIDLFLKNGHSEMMRDHEVP